MIREKTTNILLVRPPEVIISDEQIPLEKQMHGAVLLPLGILQLGSYVRHQFSNVKVFYLDLHLECKLAKRKKEPFQTNADIVLKYLKEHIEKIKPQIIGFTSALNAFAGSLHWTASLAKQICPSAVTVAGGHYASCCTEHIIKDRNIDYIIIGEGEIPFTKFIKEFQEGMLPDKGVFNEKIYLKNFDDFPQLDYDAIGVEKYLQVGAFNSIGGDEGRSLNLLTSRGCPNRCIYCATHNVWDYGFRVQSAQNVFNQVVALKEKYNLQTIMFVDDNFLLNRNRVKEFCELLIKNRIDINWYPSSVQINSLDEELISLMARSGCKSIGLAVESGTQRIQKLIKKNVKLDRIKNLVDHMRREGVRSHSLFVLGFPFETMDEIKATLQFAKDLKCDWNLLNIATPLLGTEMYEICRDKGYLPKDNSLVELLVRGNIVTPEFTPEILEYILYDANFRINFFDNYNYLSGEYDKVLPVFESIARSYPEHFICKYMIWLIYKKTNRAEDADAAYKDLESIYSSNPGYFDNLIKIYSMDISFEQAVRGGL